MHPKKQTQRGQKCNKKVDRDRLFFAFDQETQDKQKHNRSLISIDATVIAVIYYLTYELHSLTVHDPNVQETTGSG